ncbi:hypothetical protein SDJN03_25922, partial [Cucurbita argyrosperma subsp. sororia]
MGKKIMAVLVVATLQLSTVHASKEAKYEAKFEAKYIDCYKTCEKECLAAGNGQSFVKLKMMKIVTKRKLLISSISA